MPTISGCPAAGVTLIGLLSGRFCWPAWFAATGPAVALATTFVPVASLSKLTAPAFSLSAVTAFSAMFFALTAFLGQVLVLDRALADLAGW